MILAYDFPQFYYSWVSHDANQTAHVMTVCVGVLPRCGAQELSLPEKCIDDSITPNLTSLNPQQWKKKEEVVIEAGIMKRGSEKQQEWEDEEDDEGDIPEVLVVIDYEEWRRDNILVIMRISK
ncbi:hypothetical protein AKJ16_DCAP22523 [Drosera capensis]